MLFGVDSGGARIFDTQDQGRIQKFFKVGFFSKILANRRNFSVEGDWFLNSTLWLHT